MDLKKETLRISLWTVIQIYLIVTIFIAGDQLPLVPQMAILKTERKCTTALISHMIIQIVFIAYI